MSSLASNFILFLCSLNFSLFPLLHSSRGFFCFIQLRLISHALCWYCYCYAFNNIHERFSIVFAFHSYSKNRKTDSSSFHHIYQINITMTCLYRSLSLTRQSHMQAVFWWRWMFMNKHLCVRTSEWVRERGKNNKCKSKVFRGYEVIEVHCSLIYGEFFLNTCLIILFTEFEINVVILLNYSEMTVP